MWSYASEDLALKFLPFLHDNLSNSVCLLSCIMEGEGGGGTGAENLINENVIAVFNFIDRMDE
jgi:hypothetical protein